MTFTSLSLATFSGSEGVTRGRTILIESGGYELTHFDDFIDELLTKDRVCDIILPRLTQRSVLEETEGLPPRKSLLVCSPFLPRSLWAWECACAPSGASN